MNTNYVITSSVEEIARLFNTYKVVGIEYMNFHGDKLVKVTYEF